MDKEAVGSGVYFFSTSVLVIIAISALWYLLQAIGLYKIAKENNIKRPWLAWVPFGQSFLLGEIVGNRIWNFGYADWILCISEIIIVLIPIFFSLTLPVLIIYALFLLVRYCYYQTALNILYKMQDPDKSFLYLILGVLFPFLIPIWIFVLRNKKEPYYKNYHKENDY